MASPLSLAPLIRIEGACKRFGDTVALDDVSLEINAGEFFCLLGPSGCGKTTLMRMIAGFEAPDRGRISLGSEDLVAVPPHRRPVNMMFQSYALFPHLSVEGNIAYGLKHEGLGRREIAARVEEMLRLVQLEGFGARRPDRLSGGQRQRVALARALAKRPKMLLLDEPLAALDKKLREETQFELKALQARLGTTFLVVTHDQQEAMAMANRIAVMNRGRIAQVGTPAGIYEAPRTRFVAEFVGNINVLAGVVQGGERGRWRIATGLAQTPFVVGDNAPGLSPGDTVTFAVRPERMILSAEPPIDGHNLIRGEVFDTGYFGDRTVWRVKVAGGEIVRVARSNVTRFSGSELGLGQGVYLSFAPDSAVILAEEP